MTEENPTYFWNDNFTGEAEGGYFVRSEIKNFIDLLTKNGKTVVGIKYDGTYNLEFIVDQQEIKENDSNTTEGLDSSKN